MFHFPYLGPPIYSRYSRYGYQYPYHTYGNNYYKYSSNNTYKYNKNCNNKKNNDTNSNNFSKCDKPKNDYFKDKNFNSVEENPCFTLFGINLYFDDILLVCLIWFLYDEGVKDEGLFIALVLLLLS